MDNPRQTLLERLTLEYERQRSTLDYLSHYRPTSHDIPILRDSCQQLKNLVRVLEEVSARLDATARLGYEHALAEGLGDEASAELTRLAMRYAGENLTKYPAHR